MNKHMLSLVSIFAVSFAFAGAPAPSSAQDYPVKPVRFVTAGVGSISDVIARLIGQGIAPTLGQQVIVDNRAAGIIPVVTVTNAPADGYTVLIFGSVVWLAQYLQDNVPFEPMRDLAPITMVANSPNVLVVHPSLPVKSVRDLIALAKARPGVLNYASSGPGSSSHLAGELFKSMAHVDIVRVNYKSIALAFNDVLTGQVHMMFATTGSVASHLSRGTLRALAVTSLEPSQLMPGLPTVAATGLPGFESGSKVSMFVPAKTPEANIRRLNQEAVRYLHAAETKERFLKIGVEAIGSLPAELVAAMQSEISRMGSVIKSAGIRAQ